MKASSSAWANVSLAGSTSRPSARSKRAAHRRGLVNTFAYAEQAEEIGRSRRCDDLKLDTAQARDLLGDIAHVRRLVDLAAMGHRRQIRCIGFYEHALEGNAAGDLLQSDGVLESDDA